MPRIKHKRFKNILKYLEADEREKEEGNVKALDKEIEHIIDKKTKPIKEFIKKESKASKRKPIDTHALLKGFI
jgi:hypothetical protein